MNTDHDDVAARWREGLTRTAARAYEAAHGNPIPDTNRGMRVTISRSSIVAVSVAMAIVALLVWWTFRPNPVDAIPVVVPSEGATVATELWIHVSGEVHSPGLVALPHGSRVADAVDAAGGFAPGADQASVNLARVLHDGEQIDVPQEGDPDRSAKVNINRATASELEALPGVGPVLAARIVANREAEGSFRSMEDLIRVSGVGPSVLESIAAEATV